MGGVALCTSGSHASVSKAYTESVVRWPYTTSQALHGYFAYANTGCVPLYSLLQNGNEGLRLCGALSAASLD